MTPRTRIRAAVLALAIILALTACDSEAETLIPDIDLRTSGQEG